MVMGMGTADDERAAWQEQRGQAISAHAAADARRRAAEVEQARELIAQFVRQARERGLRLTPLTARAYNGRTRYRTGLRGWYLRTDHSMAISGDGQFYILSAPATIRAKFTGVVVQPQEPRLVIGAGGRDGESIPLQVLLRRRLDAGDDWP
jgi:hypothetical protein